MEIYGVYDTKRKEQCVLVGTLIEVKKFLGLTARGINKALKGNLVKDRYEIAYCYKEMLRRK